jgi:hypothetical protein
LQQIHRARDVDSHDVVLNRHDGIDAAKMVQLNDDSVPAARSAR